MTDTEMREQIASRNAILSELNRIGLRPLAGTEDHIVKWFAGKGVTATVANGFLEMKQADGSVVVPSRACTTLRTEHPEFFASNPRFDKVSSLEDLNRGTPREVLAAKNEYILEHGIEAYSALPRTRELATLRSAEVGPGMTRQQYLALSFSEKSRLAGIIGANGIGQVMARTQ